MKYLGIDLGSKRIGLAVSDERGIVAKPLAVLTPASDAQAIELITEVCKKEGVEALVIGIPFSSPEKTQGAYRHFGEKLSRSTELPIYEWDETFTTKQAQNMVAFSDRPARKISSKHRDNIAAAIILQEFLDDGN